MSVMIFLILYCKFGLEDVCESHSLVNDTSPIKKLKACLF